MNHYLKGNNKKQWEQLVFSLEQRDKSTLILIGFDSYSIQKIIYNNLKNKFLQYSFFDLDLSAESIESLNLAFKQKLPEKILNSKAVEYIVNVFGLENSLFSIKNNRIEASLSISELNFEREILFQRYPFVTIIWTDFYTIDILQKEAKDLWDWISYHYKFKTDKNIKYIPDIEKDIKDNKPKIFISYTHKDYEIAERLFNDLTKAGFKPWLDRKELFPGQNWIEVASKAIKESSFFLALISSNSLKRGYVLKELLIAFDTLNELPSGRRFVIPVYVEPCYSLDKRLSSIQGVNLYPSYEKGLERLLHALRYYEKYKKDESIEFLQISKKQRSEIEDRIKKLLQKYDPLKADDTLKERLIKEKVNIQKLLGQEYMKLKDYKKAEQSFRIALDLTQHSSDLEHEKDEIAFLLNQVCYKP